MSLNMKFENGNRSNASAALPNKKLRLMATKEAKMLPHEFLLLKPTSKLRRITVWEALWLPLFVLFFSTAPHKITSTATNFNHLLNYPF
jgi:hypothetical protein